MLSAPSGGFGGVAVLCQGAALALGGAGGAGIPAEEHHPVAEVVGLLGRDPLPQLPLHLKGIRWPPVTMSSEVLTFFRATISPKIVSSTR